MSDQGRQSFILDYLFLLKPSDAKIQGTMVDTLCNPEVGANILFISFALSYFSDEPLVPTKKTFKDLPP